MFQFRSPLIPVLWIAAFLSATTAEAQVSKSLSFSESSPLSSVTRSNSRAWVTVDLSNDTVFASGGGGIPWNPNLEIQIGGGTDNSTWQWSNPVFEDPNDPTSRVLAATLHYVVDSIDAGETLSGYTITNGNGAPSGTDLGADFSDRIEIDTGTAKFVIAKDGTILEEASVKGNQILSTGANNALYTVSDGIVYSSKWGTANVALEANGPAYCRVSVTGVMADVQGNILTDYELELCAYADGDDLYGTYEISPGYWTTSDDLNVTEIYLISEIAGGASPVLSAATKARSVLSGSNSSHGLQLGSVTSSNPDPYQAMSLTEAIGSRGLTTVSRTAASQWPVTIDGSGGYLTLNVGFTSHFVANNPEYREAAEFSLAVSDAVPTDLERYGTEVVHEVDVSVSQ